MKKLILFLAAFVICGQVIAYSHDYVSYVNTLQGSYNVPEFSHGRCTPIVGVPDGVSFWSPSGFSMVKEKFSGLGGNGITISAEAGAGTGRFVADKITAGPHLFGITDGDGVVSEVTASENCAVFRFDYPRGKAGNMKVSISEMADVSYDPAAKRLVCRATLHSNHYVISDHVYLILDLDKAPAGYEIKENHVRFSFVKGADVTIKTAVSRISHEQAQINMNRELSGKDFDDIASSARKAWNDRLGLIHVEGGNPEHIRTFYSCLYRASLRPARSYEIDKDGNPHFSYDRKVYDGYYHSNPILWDAYRSLFALENIIDTEEQKQYVQSLMKTKPLTGWWPTGHVMIGNHAISVLADAWAKGIRTFDPEEALRLYYEEITHSVLDTLVNGEYNKEHVRGFGRMGHEDYFALGYIPYPQDTDRVMETTSKTIEYNYDDFCAYRLAQMTGNRFYEELFARHIYNYRNVFDPSDGFFKGRDRQGQFDADFNPYEWGGPFVEGNGWQWRFAVQHDAKGMMDLMGGEERFIANLDELFAAPSDSVLHGGYGYRIHEINEAVAGAQGQYAQGNEPCFHVIHLYNHAGQPWKAQKLLRESLTKLFNSSPKGFPGDEDGGAMSSWYVFNSMGFYPVTPGVPQYVIGSPLFDKVIIRLENGRQFVIEAEGNAEDHCYIKSATLDGKEYTKSWIAHEDIMKGGTLRFEMSDEPAMDRGTAEEDRPFSMSLENNGQEIMTGNPLFEGRYADPEVAVYGDLFWIFPTTSGRHGQVMFDAFSSPDLRNWTKHEEIFTNEGSDWIKKCLWAPATVCKDGKYYIFFSANDIQHPDSKWWNPEVNKVGEVGGIGVAVAENPGGPYKDLLGKPLLNEFYNMAQPIDQFVFEDNGTYYMIYGGWGRCNIAQLNDDFTGIVQFANGDMVKEITPEGYVEGPVMFRRNGKLYFLWSEGDWANHSYHVAYAVADSPFGPFERKGTILSSDYNIASGPGHNSVLNIPGTDEWYIVYHRRPIPNDGAAGHRVTCIDRMRFDEDGSIIPVVMTESGVPIRMLK